MHLIILVNVQIGLTICAILQPNTPKACPRKVNTSDDQTTLVIACCPDYFEENGTCKECKAGTFGLDCQNPCMQDYYGVGCKNLCKCSAHESCDPVVGCTCEKGLTGSNCDKNCSDGYYGLKCNETCLCAHDASCHPTTGQCSCPPGWYGRYCTEECPSGMFGENCESECNCPHNADCSVTDGQCNCHGGYTGESCMKPGGRFSGETTNERILFYIIMTGSVIVLVAVVSLVVKAKQWVCHSVKYAKKSVVKVDRNRLTRAVRINATQSSTPTPNVRSQSLTTVSHIESQSITTLPPGESQSAVSVDSSATQARYDWPLVDEYIYYEIEDVNINQQA